MEKAFWTVEEASTYLNVKASTIYSWAKVGGIPCFKIGKMLRFKKEEIDTWMENHRGNGINPEIKAKEIFRKIKNPTMNIDSLVKKTVEEVKKFKYTPGYGKSDRKIRGLNRKEVEHGSL